MPDVRTVPALPWPTGDGGGTIKLSRVVTEQQLIDGILKITLDNDGREYNASILRDQHDTLRIKADNDVFIISPIPHGSDTLTLTRIDDPTARAYSLINVELNKLEPGIYGFSDPEIYLPCFLLKEDGVVYPIYKRHEYVSNAYWWIYDYEEGQVYPDEGNYPCDQNKEPLYREKLAKYGLTEVDLYGENVEELTIDEVTVI